MLKLPLFATFLFSLLLVSSCTVIKVADTAASATIGAATTTVKATGKVIDLAIPDGADSEHKQ